MLECTCSEIFSQAGGAIGLRSAGRIQSQPNPVLPRMGLHVLRLPGWAWQWAKILQSCIHLTLQRYSSLAHTQAAWSHVLMYGLLHSHLAGLAVQVVHPVSYPALAGPAELQAVMQLGCILADQAEQEGEVLAREEF